MRKQTGKIKLFQPLGCFFFSILSKERRIKDEKPPANTYTWSSVHPEKEYSGSLNLEMEIKLGNY